MGLLQLQKKIMQYRKEIMGVATIWVMLFHSSLSCPIRVVQHIINTGYIGVDIFAFLSGMSMFYSFSVNCECDAKEFLKRRMTRIIPTYLVFFVLTKLYSFLVERGGNFSSLYEDMHRFVFWQNLVTYRWYVLFILVMYLFTPIIHGCVSKWGGRYAVCVFAFVMVSSVFFFGKSTILMQFLRIVDYVLGYYYSYSCFNSKITDRRISIGFTVGLIMALFSALYVLLYRFDDITLCEYGLYWYPAVFVSFPLMILIVFILDIRNKQSGYWLLNIVGTYSLEIYLWHFGVLCLLGGFSNISRIRNLLVNVFAALGTILLSVLFNRIIERAKRALCKAAS